ncbi:hypothetical protein POM88_028657 [Heracleum sosnowskyi]|uniref:Endonuclease/exonuclease/phosphatase domain-containing protein n=1 Tax=Heracleum sosnowskyi TaxID=360622 RepID=A0AAD8HTK6_9APIA|nr:hypothetical protein POM88_028657 [Heracleum sosnowskyi]
MIGAKWLREDSADDRIPATGEAWNRNDEMNTDPQNQEIDHDPLIQVEKVKSFISFDGAFTIETRGHNGGLAFLWRNQHEVELLSYSTNHVDVLVDSKGWNKYRLTGFYGEPDRAKRKDTWDLIKKLHGQMTVPWVVIGDMNNITHQEEKRGGRPYPNWLIKGFQQCIEDCGLVDLGMEGYPYTWERGHGTDQWMEIRLDRALVSSNFMNQFTDAKLVNLKISTSDHNPILLEPFTRSKYAELGRGSIAA